LSPRLSGSGYTDRPRRRPTTARYHQVSRCTNIFLRTDNCFRTQDRFMMVRWNDLQFWTQSSMFCVERPANSQLGNLRQPKKRGEATGERRLTKILYGHDSLSHVFTASRKAKAKAPAVRRANRDDAYWVHVRSRRKNRLYTRSRTPSKFGEDGRKIWANGFLGVMR